MSISATANTIDRGGDVANHLRLVVEDPMAGLIGQRFDADELLARIDALEQEILLLQHRDMTLSRSMRKLDEEQRLAARIQQDFLPKSMPRVGPFTFDALYRPAHYVSGDLYDVRRLDEAHVGLYIADAVGHGMPAALLTMFMKNALATKRILAGGYELLEPAATMSALNAALRSQNLDHASFATAIYARVNCESREVRFARGGHPNPIILRADGSAEELTADGSLLGVFDDCEWAEGVATLSPGDRLFFTPTASKSHSPKEIRGRRAMEARALRAWRPPDAPDPRSLRGCDGRSPAHVDRTRRPDDSPSRRWQRENDPKIYFFTGATGTAE